MLLRRSIEDKAYLADFGLARILESSAVLSASGTVLGTPQYMAPEQALGQDLDHRCDIYALGIVAYELFAGAPPFQADTPLAVLMKHVREPIPIPAADRVCEPLLTPVLKALAKDRNHRWGSALSFIEALDRGVPEMGAEPPTLPVADAAAMLHLQAPPAIEPAPAAPLRSRRELPRPVAQRSPTVAETSRPTARERSSRAVPVVLAAVALSLAAVVAAMLLQRQREPVSAPLPMATVAPTTLRAAAPAKAAPIPTDLYTTASAAPPATLPPKPVTSATLNPERVKELEDKLRRFEQAEAEAKAKAAGDGRVEAQAGAVDPGALRRALEDARLRAQLEHERRQREEVVARATAPTTPAPDPSPASAAPVSARQVPTLEPGTSSPAGTPIPTPAGSASEKRGLGKFLIDECQVMNTVKDPSGWIGLLLCLDGKSYFVRPGSRLRDGLVGDIDALTVTFSRPRADGTVERVVKSHSSPR